MNMNGNNITMTDAEQSARQVDNVSSQRLGQAVSILLKEQGFPVEQNRLHSAMLQLNVQATASEQLTSVLSVLGVHDAPQILSQADLGYLPLLVHHREYGWGRIVQFSANQWRFQTQAQTHFCAESEFDFIAKLQLSTQHIQQKQRQFTPLLKETLGSYRGVFTEAIVASLAINVLALATSMFSMQVYDRVIPTQSQYTLIILSTGVGLAILFEMIMKFARSRLMDKAVVGLDQRLSRTIFERLLRVRIDQMPASVGSLAAQLRGYEQIRSFFTASTLFTLVDLPMSILFIVIIGLIGSPWLSLIPVIAMFIGIWLGLSSRKKMDKAAADGAAASYAKTGILVETVEGIETIKAGAGNWRFLSRWLNIMNLTIQNDLKTKHINDNLTYTVQMLQQVSYIGIVILGSYIVMNNEMTMGGLIACTILGGRILTPVMAIPQLLMQHSHAKTATKSIENLFQLKQDNHNVDYPLSPSQLQGEYQLQDVVFKYHENANIALQIKQLNIKAGEKVAILGAIGSGKSTLLKLLSGLYATTEGTVRLDHLDINQISRETLSEQIGYLQQDHRLFQGTLRENLLIGLPAPNDDVLQTVLMRTGLIRLVANHAKGLDLPIYEGGKGLSGGQKQVLAFTRLLLTNPKIWLLDEPTASMDEMQERQCIQILMQEMQKGDKTLILSTHKPSLLALVDRIIIVSNQQIVMDGAKQQVLAHIKQTAQTQHSINSQNQG